MRCRAVVSLWRKKRPYDRDNCPWLATGDGCDWIENTCSRTNHGFFQRLAISISFFSLVENRELKAAIALMP